MEERWEDKSQSTPIIDMGFFLFPSSLFFGQVIHALLIYKPSSCSAHTRKKKQSGMEKKISFSCLMFKVPNLSCKCSPSIIKIPWSKWFLIYLATEGFLLMKVPSSPWPISKTSKELDLTLSKFLEIKHLGRRIQQQDLKTKFPNSGAPAPRQSSLVKVPTPLSSSSHCLSLSNQFTLCKFIFYQCYDTTQKQYVTSKSEYTLQE